MYHSSGSEAERGKQKSWKVQVKQADRWSVQTRSSPFRRIRVTIEGLDRYALYTTAISFDDDGVAKRRCRATGYDGLSPGDIVRNGGRRRAHWGARRRIHGACKTWGGETRWGYLSEGKRAVLSSRETLTPRSVVVAGNRP